MRLPSTRSPALCHDQLADRIRFAQFAHDVVALGVGVLVGRVRDLERQAGQPEPGVARAGADPRHVGARRRHVGVEPEARRIDILELLQARAPKSARGGVCADCRRSPSESRCPGRGRTETASRTGPPDRARSSTNAFTMRHELPKAQPIGLHPADGGERGAQLVERADEHEVDGIGRQSVAQRW